MNAKFNDVQCSICGNSTVNLICECGRHDVANCQLCGKAYTFSEPMSVNSREDDNPLLCSQDCLDKFLETLHNMEANEEEVDTKTARWWEDYTQKNGG